MSKPIYIGNIYRSPKDNFEFYNEFINAFSPILENFEMNNKEVIVTDDFNIDLLKVNDEHIISEYFDMLTSYSFYPKITVPTRLTNNHGTLIDNFLCKLAKSTIHTTAGVLIKKFSDHQPYFIHLNNVQIRDSLPVFVKVTKQDNESRHNFYNELLTSNELLTLQDSLNENTNNTSYIILHQVIQNAKTKHMPSKFVKWNKYKHKKSKWITSGIIKYIQYRDNLYKKLILTQYNLRYIKRILIHTITF